MGTLNASRPYRTNRHDPRPEVTMLKLQQQNREYQQRNRQRARTMWFPAKIMAVGFILTLCAMLSIPALRFNSEAIIVLFIFAASLNLAIVLPLGVMILRGTLIDARTGTLFGL